MRRGERAFVRFTGGGGGGHQASLKVGLEAPSLVSINLNYTCMQAVKRCSVSMYLGV